jgi:hypothetical protein
MRAVVHMAVADAPAGMNPATVIAVMPMVWMPIISIMAIIGAAIVIAIVRPAIIRVIPVIG